MNQNLPNKQCPQRPWLLVISVWLCLGTNCETRWLCLDVFISGLSLNCSFNKPSQPHFFLRKINKEVLSYTPVFLPEGSHEQRSLVGCSPWGHKELDMTERYKVILNTRVILKKKKIQILTKGNCINSFALKVFVSVIFSPRKLKCILSGTTN